MRGFAITALLLSCPAAWAETPQPNPAAPAPADCRAAEHRQLDFWIGRGFFNVLRLGFHGLAGTASQ